jgi:hypothetical protein
MIPPLPDDAAARTYVLAAVNGVLQWLPTATGSSVSFDDRTWHRELTVYVSQEG